MPRAAQILATIGAVYPKWCDDCFLASQEAQASAAVS